LVGEVIKSFKNRATERIYDGENLGGFRSLDRALARKRLDALNAATAFSDLPPLRSIHLHRLKGDRRGQWAISVNGRWRICFEFRAGDVYNVEIVDYHEG
jgi:proteic killer suppression protein